MTGIPRIAAASALVLLAGLAGCNLVPDVVSAHLRPGLECAFPASSGDTFRATLAALDDLGARPEKVFVRDGRQDFALDLSASSGEGEQPRTNLALLGRPGDHLDGIFAHHRLKVSMTTDAAGQPASPVDSTYDPMVMEYNGKAADGHTVRLTIRAHRFDHPDDTSDAETTALVRGGEAWGRSLIAKVDVHLDQDKLKSQAAAPAAKSTQEAH